MYLNGLSPKERAKVGDVAFSGVDYITLTSAQGWSSALREELKEWRVSLRKNGCVLRPWNVRGVKGLRMGPLRWGAMNQGLGRDILQASGASARRLAYIAMGWGKCTRMDVCVDYFPARKDSSYYESLLVYHEEDREAAESGRDTVMYTSGGMGWTFYCGKGGAGFKLRVYDKGAQIDGRPGLWLRWELQIGRKYAERARVAAMNSDCVDEWLKGVVVKYCDDRHIPRPGVFGDEPQWVAACALASEDNEVERMKAWFRGTVCPFVRRFKDYVDPDWILAELGYDDVVTTSSLVSAERVAEQLVAAYVLEATERGKAGFSTANGYEVE